MRWMEPGGVQTETPADETARPSHPGSSGRPLIKRLRWSLFTVAGAALVLFVFSLSSGTGGPSGPAHAVTSASTRGAAVDQSDAPDPRNDALLADQLVEARQVAARYPTLKDALADGFTQAAPYAAGIGSHYMRYDRIYLPFDVAKPSMVLFDGDLPTSKIVGLAYYVYSSTGPPAGFAGPFDHWHQHQWTCVDRSGAHFNGNDDSAGCRGRGRNAWMLHLWVVGDKQSYQTAFSDECNILT